jgi:putative aldouronate transport system permease protein
MNGKVNVMKKEKSTIVFNIISYIVIAFFALAAFLPFLILFSSSLSSNTYIIKYGYTFFPKQFSLDAYKLVFQQPQKTLNAYSITIFLTVVGTVVSTFLSAMAAYVLFRREVKYRNALSFFIYFTTLFNGGLVAYYLMISTVFHLKDTIWVLLLSPMFNAMFIIMLRNFIKTSIPEALIESARIDGAGDMRIFLQIVLPLAKASLATIGLFTALNYWNDWWTPMVFLYNDKLYPMQYLLYRILTSTNATKEALTNVSSVAAPKETLKVAMTVITTLPIIIVYPFVQKYFVQGITVGSVKG